METSSAGPSELRSDGDGERDSPVRNLGVRLIPIVRVTHGGWKDGLEPCGKCGCTFVNVACPRIWPIGTVALTCSKCGSVVRYLDNLLIMSVRQALREQHGRDYVVRYRRGIDLSKIPSSPEAARELIFMGLDGGMAIEEVAEVLSIDLESVKRIVEMEKGK